MDNFDGSKKNQTRIDPEAARRWIRVSCLPFRDRGICGTSLVGLIVGMKEQSGRHCFRLACDSRREPRTYRGRVQAAQALQTIDDLKRLAKKHRWSIEELIIRSWDGKPRASQSMDAE